MASANQIIEILRSHFEGDDERFRTIALQIAANEARMGHEALAKDIQRILEKNQSFGLSQKLKVSQSVHGININELSGLMDTVQTSFGFKQMVLSAPLKQRLDRILKEQRSFNRLYEHNLRPRHRLLLVGPSGCGKTMTAKAIAHDLGLPLFVIRLDAIFTKYLGETASKLRLVFDTIERQRSVFLFDEFDSLGLARGTENDVGEMRRILNSFLVFIDNMKSTSIIIAASNHPEVLDKALFRRFDDIIEYAKPSRNELELLLKNRLLRESSSSIDWSKVLVAMNGMSFAEAERVASEAIKEKVIEGLPKISTELLIRAAAERKKLVQK